MPRHDNTFGGGNYDADDLDEWMTLQRDWQVDAGIEPAERGRRAGRARARRARDPGGLRRARLPARDRRGDRGGHARPLQPRPARPRPRRGRAGRRPRAGRAHHRPPTWRWRSIAAASREVAERVVGMQRQRVSADYLQTSAVIDAAGRRALRRQRPQRLPRPGHRLRARGRALGAAAGAAARGRPGRPSASSTSPTGPTLLRDLGASARGARARRGRRRGRPGLRRRAARDDRRHPARGGAAPDLRGHRGGGRALPRRSASAAPPTSPSSPTTARSSPARASRSACSRRARR